MDVQQVWLIAAIAALTAGLAGYFIGRSRPDPRATQAAEARIQALEAEIGQRKAELDRQQAELDRQQVELDRQQVELDGYRGAVDVHLDKTATLFVEMAGSYRNLFQHLSSDYEKLSTGSARDRFKARISALLLEDERTLSPVDGADPERGTASGRLETDRPEPDPTEQDPPGSTQRDKVPDDTAPGR